MRSCSSSLSCCILRAKVSASSSACLRSRSNSEMSTFGGSHGLRSAGSDVDRCKGFETEDVDHKPTDDIFSSMTSHSVRVRRGIKPIVSRRCSDPTCASGGNWGSGALSAICSIVGTLPSLCKSLRATLAGTPLRSDSKSYVNMPTRISCESDHEAACGGEGSSSDLRRGGEAYMEESRLGL